VALTIEIRIFSPIYTYLRKSESVRWFESRAGYCSN